MLTFDSCHRKCAAETPAKYERDLKYVTYYFDKSIFFRNGETNERSFSNPHPRVTGIPLTIYYVATGATGTGSVRLGLQCYIHMV